MPLMDEIFQIPIVFGNYLEIYYILIIYFGIG